MSGVLIRTADDHEGEFDSDEVCVVAIRFPPCQLIDILARLVDRDDVTAGRRSFITCVAFFSECEASNIEYQRLAEAPVLGGMNESGLVVFGTSDLTPSCESRSGA